MVRGSGSEAMQSILAPAARRSKSRNSCRWCDCNRSVTRGLAILAAAVLMAPGAAALAQVTTQKAVPGTKPSAAHTRRHVRPKLKTASASPPQAQAPPAAPPAPQWPVNDPPSQASVVWGARGLSIDAKNSSLQEILKEISARTGTKIEGMAKDERVFGVYGPGQPRDVLSQLLEGSGYNVLMVGNGEDGAPRQIDLSARPEGGTQPNAPVSPGDMYQPPIAPYEPPQPIGRPNEPPRTPQQILQEMQQRQQQLREEQMRQQQQQ